MSEEDGGVTLAMIYDVTKAVEEMLARMTDDMREIKQTLGRIGQHSREIGG